MHIRLPHPIKFVDGHEGTDFVVHKRGRKIALAKLGSDFPGYRISGLRDMPWTIVPPPTHTITAKTSENRRVTFCFMGKSYDGPARFVDIQFHDRGTTIPNASDGVSPTFNAFAVTGRGRHVTDSRPLDEAHKPSILVLLMDEAGDEPAHPAPSQRPMNDRELSSLLRRAATVIAAPDSEVRSGRESLIDILQAEAAKRDPRGQES